MLNKTNKAARLAYWIFFIFKLTDRKLQLFYAAMIGITVMQQSKALYQLY